MLVVGLKPRHAFVGNGVAVLVNSAAYLGAWNRRIVRRAVIAAATAVQFPVSIGIRHPSVATAPVPATETRLTHRAVAIRIAHAECLSHARGGGHLAEGSRPADGGVHARARRIAGVDGTSVSVITGTHKGVRSPRIYARILWDRCISIRHVLMVSCIEDEHILMAGVVMVSCIQTEHIIALPRIHHLACGRAAEEAEGEDSREMA